MAASQHRSDHRSCVNDILPIDIFHYILIFAHHYLRDSNAAKADIAAFTSNVSVVCRSWRNSALQIPCLWSTIVFDKLNAPSFQQQALWIERSQELPLDIRLDEGLWKEAHRNIDRIQELLRPQAHRWRELVMPNAPVRTITPLFDNEWGEQISAPKLEKLMVSANLGKTQRDFWEGWKFDAFIQTPNLRILYLESIPSKFPNHMFQAEGLKRLRISGLTLSHNDDIAVSQILMLLELNELVELEISYQQDIAENAPIIRGLPTEHYVVRSESLRSFSVPSNILLTLLPFIDLPNLQSMSGLSLAHYSAIRDLPRRPNLLSMSVYDPYREDLSNLARFVSLFPNLASLELLGFDFREYDHSVWLTAQPTALSSLILFTCSGLTGEWLCSVVRGRLDAQPEVTPLIELHVVTEGENGIKDTWTARAEWESWLSTHVEKLELEVRSCSFVIRHLNNKETL